MIEGAALIYGLAASFIVSSVKRNNQQARPNPRKLTYAAYVMMGASFGSFGLVGMLAVRHMIA